MAVVDAAEAAEVARQAAEVIHQLLAQGRIDAQTRLAAYEWLIRQVRRELGQEEKKATT